jgi:deazaflavin-dependent oxidoreductase (nitroreductase family)
MAKNTLSAGEAKAIQLFSKYVGGAQAFLYRVSGGKLGGTLRGAPVLLLTTTGRKSGKARTSPLLYLREGDDVFVVASKGGFATHPAWYQNLSAKPETQVQIGSEVSARHAHTLSEAEKAAVWPKLVAMYPDYQMYQDRTDRSIPVVRLRNVHNS